MRAREYLIPLQGLLAVTICFGMIWMVYAMAFFDPTPPTAAEIRSLATTDPEIDGYKTAAVMTVNALFSLPTQIVRPTGTPTMTMTRTPTVTASVTSTVTNTATGTATLIIVVSPTRREESDPPVIQPVPPTPTATLVPTLPTEPPTEPPTELPTEETPTEETPTEETPTEPLTAEPSIPQPTEAP